MTAAVAPSRLVAVGRTAGVTSVREELRPEVSGTAAGAARRRCDKTVSEGYRILKARLARKRYHVLGKGQRVGILSDSFATSNSSDTRAKDVRNDNLPGPHNTCGHKAKNRVYRDYIGGEDEGRAMAQTVHDLAPKASLDFATAFPSELGFAKNIRMLGRRHATVVTDDVTYYDEPMYQQGPVSVSIHSNRAKHHILHFSSAGNNAVTVHGKQYGSYEASRGYRPTTCPAVVAGLGYLDCHDFDPGAGTSSSDALTVKPGSGLRLITNFAEPWYGVTDDFDTFLLDDAGNELAVSNYDNPSIDEPFEIMTWGNDSSSPVRVHFVMARLSGTGTPRFKWIIADNGDQPLTKAPQWHTSIGGDKIGAGSIFGHNGDGNAVSVAASSFASPRRPERYSSDGPGNTNLFGPVRGTTPASPLAHPSVAHAPNVTGTDCARNTFFGQRSGGHWRFCGTSDAAPHLAAIAALVQDAVPHANATKVRHAILVTAKNLAAGPKLTGAGLANAAKAIRRLKH